MALRAPLILLTVRTVKSEVVFVDRSNVLSLKQVKVKAIIAQGSVI